MSVDVVTTWEGLRRLEPAWRALWEHSPASSPFQSPDWLLPWWDHFQSQKELRVISVRHDGRLVGILPLYLTSHSGKGELLLLGTGNTDHLDFVGEPGLEAAAAAAALGLLSTLGDPWDVVDLQELGAGSPLLGLPPPADLHVEVKEQSTCPMVALPDAGPVPMSSRLRSRVAQSRRKLLARGSLRRIDAGSPSNSTTPGTLIEGLMALHQARWRKRGEAGVLHDPVTQSFHREVVERFDRARLLRLFGLEVDAGTGGGLAGVFYGFARGDVSYAYLTGFDPALEQLSIGSLLVAEALETAVSERRRTFDFLRGGEPHKYRWGAIDHLNFRCLIHRR
ncbi:MAG TPA: GNAT family N-acetyltransferase [Polyangia bacterium]